MSRALPTTNIGVDYVATEGILHSNCIDIAILTDFLKEFKPEVEEEDIYGDGLVEENTDVEPKYMSIMVSPSARKLIAATNRQS